MNVPLSVKLQQLQYIYVSWLQGFIKFYRPSPLTLFLPTNAINIPGVTLKWHVLEKF